MITKAILKEHIEQLPEQFSIDELIERLKLIEKIQNGILQSKNENVISEKELESEAAQWFK